MDTKQQKTLQDAKNKIASIAAQKAALKQQECQIFSEIQESIPEEERNTAIAEAEKEFAPAKKSYDEATEKFNVALSRYNAVIDLLSYRVKSGLGKMKSQISLSGNFASILRDGKEIKIDISIADWKKIAVARLEKELGITNGTARNIIYKCSLLKKNQHSKK